VIGTCSPVRSRNECNPTAANAFPALLSSFPASFDHTLPGADALVVLVPVTPSIHTVLLWRSWYSVGLLSVGGWVERERDFSEHMV
jgi:hypothetical protein